MARRPFKTARSTLVAHRVKKRRSTFYVNTHGVTSTDLRDFGAPSRDPLDRDSIFEAIAFAKSRAVVAFHRNKRVIAVAAIIVVIVTGVWNVPDDSEQGAEHRERRQSSANTHHAIAIPTRAAIATPQRSEQNSTFEDSSMESDDSSCSTSYCSTPSSSSFAMTSEAEGADLAFETYLQQLDFEISNMLQEADERARTAAWFQEQGAYTNTPRQASSSQAGLEDAAAAVQSAAMFDLIWPNLFWSGP